MVRKQDILDLAYWHGQQATVDNPFPEGKEAVDVEDIENLPEWVTDKDPKNNQFVFVTAMRDGDYTLAVGWKKGKSWKLFSLIGNEIDCTVVAWHPMLEMFEEG